MGRLSKDSEEGDGVEKSDDMNSKEVGFERGERKFKNFKEEHRGHLSGFLPLL